MRLAIRELVTGQKPWPLYLYGPPGTGKTCAMLALVDHCPCSMFFESGDWAQVWADVKCSRREFQGGKISCSEWREWIGKWSLLAIDDAGTRSRVDDNPYEAFKMALDQREGKPLIVSSNLSPEDLAVIYDERIRDRFEAGTVIELKGKSRRLSA